MYKYDATEIAFKNGYNKCIADIIAYLNQFGGTAKEAAEEIEKKYNVGDGKNTNINFLG